MDRLIEDKIWGQINFPWEVEHLLDTPTLSRLKKIQQGGLTNQVYPHIQTTRYEHSIGVYHLLRHFGASPVQQIAGLLHDISHTAFSHVSDYLFDQTEEDYHEKFFAEFMTREDIQQALAKLAINKDEILNGDFPLLNAPLPHLSADRLDYTLRDSLAWGLIALEEVHDLINELQVLDNRFVFKSKSAAQIFQKLFQRLNEECFREPKVLKAHSDLVSILKTALNEGILKKEDLFLTDMEILEQLNASFLKERMSRLGFSPDLGQLRKQFPVKLRVVNPAYLQNREIQYLQSSPQA